MVHLAIVMNQITSVSSVGTCLNMLQTQVSSWAHITRKCTRKHVACVRTCRPDAKHSRLFSKTSLQTQASASAAINHTEAWCWGQHTPCPRLPPLLYWINHNILLLLLPNAPLSMTLMKTPPMPSSPLVFIHSFLLTHYESYRHFSSCRHFRGRDLTHTTCFPSLFDCFFGIPMTSWLEQGMRKKKKHTTAGSNRLTGGCRHPLPVVCRLGSGAPGQSAPPGPFTSGRVRIGREGALSIMTPSGGSIMFLERKRGFYCLLRIIIEQWPPPPSHRPTDIKVHKE